MNFDDSEMKNRKKVKGEKIVKLKPKSKRNLNRPIPTADIYQKALTAIVESSEDAILSKTLDGTILTWNKGAERTYGYTQEEAIGKSVRMLGADEKHNDISEILEKIKQGIVIERYETVRKKRTAHSLISRFQFHP